MRKPLIIMLLGAAFVWGCTMLVHAEDAPKWKVELRLVDQTGEHPDVVAGHYGTDDMKAVRLWDTEKACTEFLTHDKKVAERRKAGDKLVAHDFGAHAKLVWACVPDVKKDEI